MTQFFGRVQGQLGRHRVLHRSLDDFGAQPILVIGQPLAGVRLIEQLQQDVDVNSNDLASSCSHSSSSFFRVFSLLAPIRHTAFPRTNACLRGGRRERRGQPVLPVEPAAVPTWRPFQEALWPSCSCWLCRPSRFACPKGHRWLATRVLRAPQNGVRYRLLTPPECSRSPRASAPLPKPRRARGLLPSARRRPDPSALVPEAAPRLSDPAGRYVRWLRLRRREPIRHAGVGPSPESLRRIP